MAIFNQRWGWHWTDDEREERKEAVRQVQRHLARIEEQVRRIKAHIPRFHDEAQSAFRACVAGVGAIATLNITNRGPKYQPLSTDEADRLLAAFSELLKGWSEFASSPRLQEATRATNKELRRRNAAIRAHNQAVRAAAAKQFEQADIVMRLIEAGDLDGALDHAAKNGLL